MPYIAGLLNYYSVPITITITSYIETAYYYYYYYYIIYLNSLLLLLLLLLEKLTQPINITITITSPTITITITSPTITITSPTITITSPFYYLTILLHYPWTKQTQHKQIIKTFITSLYHPIVVCLCVSWQIKLI